VRDGGAEYEVNVTGHTPVMIDMQREQVGSGQSFDEGEHARSASGC
jgi:hypothetical protein